MARNIESGSGFTESERKFKEFRGDLDIFVPKSDEEAYLSSHGIEIRRLSNSALLSGATRLVEDASEASVDIEFPTGSYYEPKNIKGVTHFLEHLVSNGPGFLARRCESYYNATTSTEKVTLNLSGIANPKEPNYGIIPVIPVALDNIRETPVFSEEYLEREKRVIIGERQQRLAEPKIAIAQNFNKIIFDYEHPFSDSMIGTEEEVGSITVSDAVNRHKEVFIPKDLDARIFTHGQGQVTSYLLDKVQEKIENMQGEGRTPQPIDEELYGRMNPDFNQGDAYHVDTGFKDGMYNIYYLWLMDSRSFSVDDFSRGRMFELAGNKVFEFLRENGIGYSADIVNIGAGLDKIIMGFKLQIPKINNNTVGFANQLYPLLKDKVFGTFGDEDFSFINDVTHRRLNAVPTTVSDRYNLAMYGLKEYGRVIDSERIPEIHKMITPSYLKRSVERFTSVDPAILVVGDLG